MKKEKILTIAIPTYNRKKDLVETLKALTPQLTDEVEILILDNNSNYDIEKILEENFNSTDSSKIKLKRNKFNIGANANIVKCFEKVATDWMWLLGDDEIILDNAVQIILNDIKICDDTTLLIKYSSSICEEKETKEVKGLEGNIDYLSETLSEKRFGNLLFISTSVYRVKKITKYLDKGYHYTGSCAAHIIMLFFVLEDRESKVIYSKKKIVEIKEERETYSNLYVGLGLLFSTKNLAYKISEEHTKKMRKFFDLFTYSIRTNFLQLYFYGYKENFIKDYKKIFKELYNYSKERYSLSKKIEFHILYFIIDKPFFIELMKKISKKFKKNIESYSKEFYARI